MSYPHSLENTMRRHDKAFYDWLGGLRVDYDGAANMPTGWPESVNYPTRKNFPILRVMATRQRAVAAVTDLLVMEGWIGGSTADEMRRRADDFTVLPLPVATFERGDPIPDPQTAGVPKKFRRSIFNQQTLLWENHPWPACYLVPFTVTFWCAKRATEAYIREWIYSQFGLLGMGDSEALIPVEHSSPWGTHLQALRLEGTADQSDLEGDGFRFIRYEASFQLRFLHMRPIAETAHTIEATQPQLTFPQITDGVTTDAFDRTPDVPSIPLQSFNLFEPFYVRDADIAAKWPRSGSATVRRSTIAPEGVSPKNCLATTVRAVTDRVGIIEKPILVTGSALVSIALRYRSTAEVSIAMHETNGATPVVWTPVRDVVLPTRKDWTDLQLFALIDQPIFSAVVQGRAIESSFWFCEVDVRHIFNATAIAATTNVPAADGATRYVWSGLAQGQSYLAVVVPSAYSGSWNIRVQDDDGSPNHVIKRTFDASVERGFVEIIQPKSNSVSVTLPSGFTAASLYLQPYVGGFRGRLVA